MNQTAMLNGKAAYASKQLNTTFGASPGGGGSPLGSSRSLEVMCSPLSVCELRRCEANYAVTYYVAEFWNTISSLPMIYMGWYGLKRTRSFASPEHRFSLAFMFLGVVGVGSTLFHMTLRKWAQLLDEVPMLMCNAVFLYCLMENGRRTKHHRLPEALAALAALLVVCYVLLDLYWVFILGYGSLLIIISAWALMLAIRGAISTTARVLAGLAFVIYFAGVSGSALPPLLFTHALISGLFLWILDRSFCSSVVAFHLHAWWHLMAGFGTYLFIMFTVSTRAWRFSKTDTIEISLLPYVSYK